MPFGAISIRDLEDRLGLTTGVVNSLEAEGVYSLAGIRRKGGVPALGGLSEGEEQAVLKSMTSAWFNS